MNADHPRSLTTQELDIGIVEQLLETLQRRQLDGPDPERQQAIHELRTILNHAVHDTDAAPDRRTGAVIARLALDQLEQRGEISPQTWQMLRLLKRSHTGTLGTESARRIRRSTPPAVISEILTLSVDGDDQAAARQVKVLADRGDVETLGQRADMGDRDAALQLARLLAARGDAEQLTSRAEAGDQFAALQLARLLAARGDIDALTQRANAGDRDAASQLAELHARRGDPVLRALEQLPSRQRQVMMAWTYDGATPAEIAIALQITPDEVRANLYKARTVLRTLIDKQEQLDG